MAAASVQGLSSGLAGVSSFAAGSNRASEFQPTNVRLVAPAGFGPSKGLGSWKTARRRAGVQCSLGISKVFGGVQGLPKLPLGTFLGDLRENNKDVKWALDYWDQELIDGYKSLDEWKEQLSNLRQGNPTIKWAFDYWDKELEDGYKSLDEWGAALADIQAGTWLDKMRAGNPDVKWALDYWDQELIDGYKSLDEWKAQAADLSGNPLYVALGVGALVIPILLYVILKKGYAGNLSASEAFARLNGEDSALLVDIRSKEEKAAEGGPKLGKKVLAVAAEGDGNLTSAEELRTAVKGRVADTGIALVVLDSNGAAAPQAAKALTKEGYTRVYVLTGGAEGPQGWRESQLPWRTPQTFTLDLGEIKDAVASKIQELQENKQVLPILGAAAAAGVSLILFTEAETALQLLGSAAVMQVLVKRLLSGKDREDREETVRQVQSALDTKVAPKELQGLTGQVTSKAEAIAEAENAEASPAADLSTLGSSSDEGPAQKTPANVNSKVDLKVDPETTEDVIPEANVPDFLVEEEESARRVAEQSRAQAAAAAAKPAEVDKTEKGRGAVGVTPRVSEAEALKAPKDVMPGATAEEVLAAAEAEIPEANVADDLSMDSAVEDVRPVAKAEDVLKAAEAEIPEANVADETSKDVLPYGTTEDVPAAAKAKGAKANDAGDSSEETPEEDVVKAAEAETPEASVSKNATERRPDARAEGVLEAAEAEIPEANVADVLSEGNAEGVDASVVAARPTSGEDPEKVADKAEEVNTVANNGREEEDLQERVKAAMKGLKERIEAVGEGSGERDAREAVIADSPSARGSSAFVEPVKEAVGGGLEAAKWTAEEVQDGAKSAAKGVKSKAEELAATAAQNVDTAEHEEELVKDASTSSDTSAFGQVADVGSKKGSKRLSKKGKKSKKISPKVSEPITKAAGDLQEKSAETAEGVSRPVAELASKSTEVVSDLAGKGKEAVSETSDAVSDAVSEAVIKAREAIKKARDAMSEVVVPEPKETGKEEVIVKPTSGALETVGELEAAVGNGVTAEQQKAEEQAGELGVEQKEDQQEQDATAEGDENKVKEATRAIKEAFAPGTEPSSSEGEVITLLYESGWDTAFLHFSADGGAWTDLPGVRLGYDAINGFKAIEIPASSIQFVLTNGAGDWDMPPSGGNYIIGSSGTYRLSFGTISSVSKVGK